MHKPRRRSKSVVLVLLVFLISALILPQNLAVARPVFQPDLAAAVQPNGESALEPSGDAALQPDAGPASVPGTDVNAAPADQTTGTNQGTNAAGQHLHGRVTPAERKAAAARVAPSSGTSGPLAAGTNPKTAELTPGATPDYFGTTPNFANTSLLASASTPTITITGGGAREPRPSLPARLCYPKPSRSCSPLTMAG